MNVFLVAMPWQALDCPSLALAILKQRVTSCSQRHQVTELNATLRWAEYLTTKGLSPSDSIEEYFRISNHGAGSGVGDWIFSPALHGVSEWRVDEFVDYLHRNQWDAGRAPELHRISAEFIHALADEIIAANAEVVGMSTTFMQTVSSLALARCIKKRRASVRIVLGGANCDGSQGIALHRNYDFVDFVIRGEGEQAFVELLDAVDGHRPLSSVSGLCWRGAEGTVVNPPPATPFPLDKVPCPDYSAYFSSLDSSHLREYIRPVLLLETARGCWWGERHQCTFCGVNGSQIAFRSKPADLAFEHLCEAVTKHKCLDVCMVDNILDNSYFTTLLPQLARLDWDLRIHYDLKSNLTPDKIRMLREAHVFHIQPGIESLSSPVLRRMRKGVSGHQNVLTLRECENNGITVAWSCLYGFPGETEADYGALLPQLKALVHLQPPYRANKIFLQRFSPYFEQPALGHPAGWPAPFYGIVHDLPQQELGALACLHDAPRLGICDTVAEKVLRDEVDRWRRAYPRSSLTWRAVGDRIYIYDRRVGWPKSDLLLERPTEVQAYRALQQPHSLTSLRDSMERAGHGVPPHVVDRLLRRWCEKGLLFHDLDRYVAIATVHDSARVRATSRSRRSEASRPDTCVDVGA